VENKSSKKDNNEGRERLAQIAKGKQEDKQVKM
jgi:hypothetical protein